MSLHRLASCVVSQHLLFLAMLHVAARRAALPVSKLHIASPVLLGQKLTFSEISFNTKEEDLDALFHESLVRRHVGECHASFQRVVGLLCMAI